MTRGPLDRPASLPQEHRETCADRGYGYLVGGVAIPVGRRGPQPVEPGTRELSALQRQERETAAIVSGECLTEFGTGREAGWRSSRHLHKTERRKRMMKKRSTGFRGNPLDGGATTRAF